MRALRTANGCKILVPHDALESPRSVSGQHRGPRLPVIFKFHTHFENRRVYLRSTLVSSLFFPFERLSEPRAQASLLAQRFRGSNFHMSPYYMVVGLFEGRRSSAQDTATRLHGN